MPHSDDQDSSMVEVLYEAASTLSRAEVYRLINLFERLVDNGADPVSPIVVAIASLSVEEMARLRHRLRQLLATELPPAPPSSGSDGHAGAGVRVPPRPPRLLGGAAKALPR